jgi:hypothetical protein
MLRRVAFVRTDVLLCCSSLTLSTLMMETVLSSKTLVITRATRYCITEDGILQLCEVYTMEYVPMQKEYNCVQYCTE